MVVEIWDLETAEKKRIFSMKVPICRIHMDHPVCLVALKKRKDTLAVGYEDGNMVLFNTQDGSRLEIFKTGGRFLEPPVAVCELENGSLVTANLNVEVWKLPQGNRVQISSMEHVEEGISDMVVVGGNIVACSVRHWKHRTSVVKMFDIDSRKCIRTFCHSKLKIRHLSLLSDNSLATVCLSLIHI
eukprot:TRINITY_DN5644_c0_g2_i1.p1 TRINITY_DN5644_c0_g2~~TRINITY_DN5644_c0_g2_i1.p1  ORF type:complete len:211 (-),score=15.04 TRINITY_DN5644_c0_g2_i1:37-594(-)